MKPLFIYAMSLLQGWLNVQQKIRLLRRMRLFLNNHRKDKFFKPYAWEAREFIRKKLVGQTVTFVREFTATSGREHGHIYLGGTGLI